MLLGTGSLEIKKEYKVDIVVDPYYGTKEITVHLQPTVGEGNDTILSCGYHRHFYKRRI